MSAGGYILRHVHWESLCNTPVVLFVLAFLPLLQSCAVFRSDIDENCVDQFASQYPDPEASRFILPWNTGESFMLTQGNCTFESHKLSTNQHMSFDFKMPIGTPILAAADGRIVIVIEQFKDGIDQEFNEANLIGIEHSGGILTWYMHLMHEGSRVQVDDQVLRGQMIGYSGNTGDSSYPHLHFFAQQLIGECHDSETRTAKLELCPQIPIAFSNVSPADTVLKEWKTYTALAP